MLDGVFCVIFLHGRNSPQSSPTSTPKLTKSLSFEMQPDELIEKPMSPMHYARSGLGTAEMNGKLIAAGGYNREECLRTVECYDPHTDLWSFLAPMRTPRARFQMAVLMVSALCCRKKQPIFNFSSELQNDGNLISHFWHRASSMWLVDRMATQMTWAVERCMIQT